MAGFLLTFFRRLRGGVAGTTKKPAPTPKELGQTLNVCGATQFAEYSAARFRIPAYALRG